MDMGGTPAVSFGNREVGLLMIYFGQIVVKSDGKSFFNSFLCLVWFCFARSGEVL